MWLRLCICRSAGKDVKDMHKIFGQREKGQYYDRSGAYLVIFSGGKTAVVRTARGLFLLGGGIQGAENDQECIRRECLEECGCECTVKEYLASAEAFSVHDTKGLFHPIQRYYMGDLLDKVQEPTEKDHFLIWADYGEIKGKMYSDMQNWALETGWKRRHKEWI